MAWRRPRTETIVQFVWPAAFTVRDVHPWVSIAGIPDRFEYMAGREHAFEAGVQLAKLLVEALGPDYPKTIQFVGHSLGTVVNAYASTLLLPALPHLKAFQFTALDRPDNVGKIPPHLASTAPEVLADDAAFSRAFGFHENFFSALLTAGKRQHDLKARMVGDQGDCI